MQHYEYEDDSAISSLSNDQRPSRPSSIELKRNYSQHVVDGNKGIIYSPTAQRYSPTNIYYRFVSDLIKNYINYLGNLLIIFFLIIAEETT